MDTDTVSVRAQKAFSLITGKPVEEIIVKQEVLSHKCTWENNCERIEGNFYYRGADSGSICISFIAFNGEPYVFPHSWYQLLGIMSDNPEIN